MALLDSVSVTVSAPPPYGMPDWADWWQVRFSASDTEAFDAALALVKSVSPRQRAYDPERRSWSVRADGMVWLASRWPGLGAAWKRARLGGEARGTSGGRASWYSTGERSSGGATERDATPRDVRDAFALLHLLPSAPADVVQAAWRALARRSHPDVAGGDGERMRALNLAYERAGKWARDRNDANNGSGASAA